jgi:hypothetical protein
MDAKQRLQSAAGTEPPPSHWPPKRTPSNRLPEVWGVARGATRRSRLQGALRAPAHPRPGFTVHKKLKKPAADRATTRSTFDRSTMQTQGTETVTRIYARAMTRAGPNRALPEPVRTNSPRASTQARGCTLRRSVRPMHCSTRYHTTEVVVWRSSGEPGPARASARARSLPSASRTRLASSGGEL